MIVQMKKETAARLLRVASILGLMSIGLIVWSVVHPKPIPVILAMSLGQGIGTLGFGLYGVVVLWEMARRNKPSSGAPTRAHSLKSQFLSEPPPPSGDIEY